MDVSAMRLLHLRDRPRAIPTLPRDDIFPPPKLPILRLSSRFLPRSRKSLNFVSGSLNGTLDFADGATFPFSGAGQIHADAGKIDSFLRNFIPGVLIYPNNGQFARKSPRVGSAGCFNGEGNSCPLPIQPAVRSEKKSPFRTIRRAPGGKIQ